ncbi:VOC family protein [Allokutzneria sp. A3M-2-11 16]|uniref:bleomycin resistance protein n=1 Tax=Allokutzneria sp. A3M-2-11 16 TaxID=2962043 RepID=UPI0020B6C516|nr:VOC family protein [Allokutzneria sp. A3M-2-11 16]MCP3803015.1 VOC family protein [Allokutzneria sp. A3M-2-11 16]
MPERMRPMLPSRSITETVTFYTALGFEVAYQQTRPNTYVSLRWGEDVVLDFFTLKQEPSDNYSTCYVHTDDVDALYAAFTGGLRAALGKVPARGYPRINPLKDMSFGVRQFIVIDPSGNHVRIGQAIGPASNGLATKETRAGQSRLERALHTATMLADSRQDPESAARILDAAFGAGEPTPDEVLFRALVLRADLAVRLGDDARVGQLLDRAEAMGVESPDEQRRIAELRQL